MLVFKNKKVIDMEVSDLVRILRHLAELVKPSLEAKTKTSVNGTIVRTKNKGYLITLPAFARGTSIEIIYDFDRGEDLI